MSRFQWERFVYRSINQGGECPWEVEWADRYNKEWFLRNRRTSQEPIDLTGEVRVKRVRESDSCEYQSTCKCART